MTDKTKNSAEPAQDELTDRSRADVGVVAALKMELDGLLARCDRERKYVGGGLTFRGAFLRDIRVAFVESGTGGDRASRATHALLDAHHPEWILSMGFAGALDETLRIGDIVVGTGVIDGSANVSEDREELTINMKMAEDPQRGLYVGKLATVRHIVRTVKEKQQIAERTGAIAVDMETLEVARVCQERKVKFIAVRGISDDCSQDLPSEVLSVLGGTGTIRTGAVVGALWKRPSSYKALWALRKNARLASDRLGLFLDSMLRQLVEPKSW